MEGAHPLPPRSIFVIVFYRETVKIMSNLTFATKGTKDIWDGKNTKDARKTLPQNLWVNFRW